MNIQEMSLRECGERRAQIKSDVEVRSESMTIDEMKAYDAELDQLAQREKDIDAVIQTREAMLKKALESGVTIAEPKKEERKMNENMTVKEIAALPEYRTGWLKKQMGVPLDEAEARSVAMTNASAVIPVETANKIYDVIKQKGNLLNKIDLYRVNGAVNVPVQGTNTAAELHTENAALNAAADTWTNIQLSAYEITKFVRFSKSLMTMAMDAFESKLAEKIAEQIVIKAEYYILYGTGSGMPKGIDKAQTWSDGTNGVDWAGAAVTAAELIELVSYLPGGHFSNADWVMNHKTFFTSVYALRDDAKYPLVKETADGFVMLGRPVILCDSAADGEIFLGDFKQVVGNLSADIVVERNDASGFAYNAIDFRGSCIFDCDIAVPTAFVKSEATLA